MLFFKSDLSPIGHRNYEHGEQSVKGSLDKTVNLWDAQTGRELATLKRARRLGLFSRLLPRRQDASFGE